MTQTMTDTGLAIMEGLVVREEDVDGADPRPRTDDGFTLESPYPVPSDESFAGWEYQHAEDIQNIARKLMDEYHDDFWHIKGAALEFLWKRMGGRGGDRVARR